MIELVIDECTPSLNPLLGQHWSHKHRLRAHWGWLVRRARLNAKVFDPPRFEHARVTIERTGSRMLDTDNLTGGCKGLIDLLVREGLIVDDSPDHIGQPVIRQIVDKKVRQTVVRIENLDG